MRIFIFKFCGSAGSAGVPPLIEALASAERRRCELSFMTLRCGLFVSVWQVAEFVQNGF